MDSTPPDPGVEGPNVSRRGFLRAGGLSVVGLSVGEQAALAAARPAVSRRSCIFLLMSGGASQLETFDPKPAAPAEIRGPLRAISTAVPGLAFSEALPGLAERATKLTVIRSLSHDAAPIHETGLQLLHTGRLARHGRRYPAFGSVVARELGPRRGVAPYVVLPRLLAETGVKAWRGQGAGLLGEEYEPLTGPKGSAGPSAAVDDAWLPDDFRQPDEPPAIPRLYGDTRFGRLCLKARQLVEAGVRTVVVNLFDSLDGRVTWDAHGRGSSPATVFDYRDTLCPQFDRALSGLLDDLEQRGLLDDTLVVASGEFGRTPRINGSSGRDHWPGVWSAVMAGGGIPAGGVIGASDRTGSVPADRPMHPSELSATIYRALGLPSETSTGPSSDSTPA
ncbi:MAG TPA: DUF1501 domain-containing protein [Planctomycetaceae bacterium]|nr:DUF1501 domain-containing protein [Planctomycetaceae bacterium]